MVDSVILFARRAKRSETRNRFEINTTFLPGNGATRSSLLPTIMGRAALVTRNKQDYAKRYSIASSKVSFAIAAFVNLLTA